LAEAVVEHPTSRSQQPEAVEPMVLVAPQSLAPVAQVEARLPEVVAAAALPEN
jgi:hypothetical protein